MTQPLLTEEVKESWEKVITAEGVAPITSRTVRNNTIRLLENTKKIMSEATTVSAAGGGAAASGFDPVLISMIRKTMPSLIANDIVGVQPMSGPTGLIFAMHANATTAAGAAGVDIFNQAATTQYAAKQATAAGEALGVANEIAAANNNGTGTAPLPVTPVAPWGEVDFNIAKVSVTAQTRALKAKYTHELAQDLKSIHGLDAEAELTNILSGEITAEMNREIVAAVTTQSIKTVVGSGTSSVAFGSLVGNAYRTITDSDARWEVENYKALYMVIVREANAIAQNTRRGLGNIIICSANVAAGLEAATSLDLGQTGGIPGSSLNTSDFIGTTFAGILGGRFKLYIDPYATVDFVTVGYKGATEYDAGIFYCPYIPLQLMKAQNSESFEPSLGMKTRYGLVTNPMTTGTAGANQYYRSFEVLFS